MTLLLTITLCIAVLGLLMLVFGLRSRPVADVAPPADRAVDRPGTPEVEAAAPDMAPEAPAGPPVRRRYGMVVTGAVLAIIGGIGTVLILNEGLESDRIDNWMIERTPGTWLVERLDSDNSEAASRARGELVRRLESDEADEELRKAVTLHYVDQLLEGEQAGRVIQMDLDEGREKRWIDDKRWAGLAAQETRLRYEVPRQVELGQPLVSQLMVGLPDRAPDGWVIASFERLDFAGEPVPPPAPVLVMPNPDFQPPAEGQEQSRPRPMIQATIQVPAEVITAAGAGQHLYYGQFHVYAYTMEIVPIPEEIRSRAVASPAPAPPGRATGPATAPATQASAQEPAVLMVELTRKEAQDLIDQALGVHTLPMERQIMVIDPAPAESEADEGADEEAAK